MTAPARDFRDAAGAPPSPITSAGGERRILVEPSLLRMGLAGRLAIAAGLIVLVWLLVVFGRS
jgi:hypothetical protein